MNTPLVRNDIPLEGSDMWKSQWNACTDALMDWLDMIQCEKVFGSVWSLWDVRDFTVVPFPSAVAVDYSANFGKDVSVKLPTNATWLDLWEAADRAIVASEDGHHVFIEEFVLNGDRLTLVTGS